jgi:hypothetical protein
MRGQKSESNEFAPPLRTDSRILTKEMLGDVIPK